MDKQKSNYRNKNKPTASISEQHSKEYQNVKLFSIENDDTKYLTLAFDDYFEIANATDSAKRQAVTSTDKQYEKERYSSKYLCENFETVVEEIDNFNTSPEADDNRDKSDPPNTDILLNGVPLIDDIKFYEEIWEELKAPFSFHEDLFYRADSGFKQMSNNFTESTNEVKNCETSNTSSPVSKSKGGSTSADSNIGQISPNTIRSFLQDAQFCEQLRVIKGVKWMHEMKIQMEQAFDELSMKSGLTLKFICMSSPETYKFEVLNYVNRVTTLRKLLSELKALHQKLCKSFNIPKIENVLENMDIDIQVLLLREKARLMIYYWSLLKKFEVELARLLVTAKKFYIK